MADGVVRVPQITSSTALPIDNTVLTRGGETIFRQRVETYTGTPVAFDTGGRQRGSQIITLFDGKIYGAEDTLKWDTKGSGTATYGGNAVNLSVTAGQYEVRQGRYFCPYFSGKPQLIEVTHSNFQNQTGVIKRFGYFSSNAVAPYNSDKDGWWIEADGSTYRLITSNLGTETHNIPWTEWDAYTEISDYDWSAFTVFLVDFLWLGGAGLRVFMVIDGAFKLVHTIGNHAGYQTTLIFNNPNQPVRYEIRSSTGAGSYNTICSQVATEGAGANEQGQGVSIFTPSITCNVVGTVYALAGVRKQAAFRNHYCPVTEFGATNILTTATPESGILLLMRNPTLSAPLTWSNNSRIQTAVATNQTISNTGRIIEVLPMSGSSISAQTQASALRVLSSAIDNAMDELIIGYSPLTTTQSVSAAMAVLEY